MEERSTFGDDELEVNEESVEDLEPKQGESEQVAGGAPARGVCVPPSGVTHDLSACIDC